MLRTPLSTAWGPPTCEENVSPRSRRIWLAAILIFAVALRVWYVDWGLPDFVFKDSLVHFLHPAARMVSSGDFVPDRFIHPPMVAFLVALPTVVWSMLTGREIQPTDNGLGEETVALVLIGRLVTIALATCSVAVLYLLGRRLLGTSAAPHRSRALRSRPHPRLGKSSRQRRRSDDLVRNPRRLPGGSRTSDDESSPSSV